MIILIDNYDSFTFNVAQYLGALGCDLKVIRNDAMSAADVMALKPEAIVLSPGPSAPDQAGICLELIDLAAKEALPLLGICLGHQSIGQAFGGKIVRTAPLHGKVSNITHKGSDVFTGLPSPLAVTRYHSLVIEPETCPACLEITAEFEGIIMGVAHKDLPIYGVQFHPESVSTDYGMKIMENFVALTKS